MHYNGPAKLSVGIFGLAKRGFFVWPIIQDLEKTDHYLKIRVSSGTHNPQILFEDNGKGIKSYFHNRIFDMFFRASEESYVSGLGL